MLTLFPSNSIKMKGVLHSIAVARSLKETNAASLALCKELKDLCKAKHYKAIFAMTPTIPDFARLPLATMQKCTQWPGSVLRKLDWTTCTLKPEFESGQRSSGKVGVPGRKKGGIFYGVHNWWSNLDAAKQRTLISEAGQLGYHLTDPKVGVFNVPAIGSHAKPTLTAKDSKRSAAMSSDAHNECEHNLHDRFLYCLSRCPISWGCPDGAAQDQGGHHQAGAGSARRAQHAGGNQPGASLFGDPD